MIYRVKQKNNPAEFSDTCSVRGEGRAVHWLPMSVGRERAGKTKKIKHAGFFFLQYPVLNLMLLSYSSFNVIAPAHQYSINYILRIDNSLCGLPTFKSVFMQVEF